MKFHARDVLCVITGKQFSPGDEKGEGIRALLNHMIGEEKESFDPELAFSECQNTLLNLHPELSAEAVNFLKGDPVLNQMIDIKPLSKEVKQKIRKATQTKRAGRA